MSLLAAVSGTLLAGLGLQVTSPLPDLSRWGFFAATTLILVSTGVCIGATMIDNKEPVVDATMLHDQVKTIVGRVRKLLCAGFCLAGAGALILLLAAGFPILELPEPATVMLTDQGFLKAQSICPDLPNPLQVDRVDSPQGTDPLVTLDLAEGTCGPNAVDDLTVARADIAAIAEA
ncbi:MAG: hypothetical protein ACRDRK_05445 [Pseudonocardia sp.]